MKKVLFLLLCTALTGCSFHTISDVSQQTIDVHVRVSDWQYTNMIDNNYFRCVIDMPEITSHVFNQGEVQVYRVFNRNTADAFKHVLPDVFHQKEVLNGETFLYTTTVDCLYGIGWLEFNYRVSDFVYDNGNYGDFAPKGMDFSIVITKSY